MIIDLTKELYIVYPTDITTHTFEQAEMLYRRIEAAAGKRAVFTHTDAPEGANVFYIGLLGYAKPAAVLDSLTYGEGRISLSDHTVIAAAHTEEQLLPLMNALFDAITADGDRLVIDDGIDGFRVHDERFLHHLPLLRGGKLVMYRRSHGQSDQLIFDGADAGTFAAYCTALEEHGFVRAGENEIRGNLFARFRKGAVGAAVEFTPFNRYLRIVAEPAENLYVSGDREYEKVCEPLVTVIGARFSTTNRYCGRDAGAGNMSYVIRLSDGRFLVIDGGLETDSYADAIREVFVRQAADPDHVVIAGWFVSHTHIDHLGGFLRYTAKYRNTIRLEQFLCNYSSIDDAEYCREAWNIRRTFETLISQYPDAKITKLHTGDRLRFADAELEILLTQEEIVRQYFTVRNEEYNCTSFIMRMFLGGNSFLFMTDAAETNCKIAAAMYGDYLHSDICQVCHHGGWGGVTELYRFVDPEVAIFSTSDSLLPLYVCTEYNHELVYNMHVREVINSSEQIRTLELPYHPTEVSLPVPATTKVFRRMKWIESLTSMETEGVYPHILGHEDEFGL